MADPRSVPALYLFQVEAQGGGSIAARGFAANDTARLLTSIGDTSSEPLPLDGLFAPASAITVLGHLKQVVETGDSHRCRIRIVARGGDASGDASFTPVLNDAGAVTTVVMVAPPTGGLGDNRREGRTARRSGTVGAFRTERGLGNVFVSAELAEMLGIPPEDALGQRWLESVHRDDRRPVAEAIGEAEQAGATLDLDLRLHRPDGTERLARLVAAPLRGEDGTVTGLVGTVEDVTERRASAPDLLQSGPLLRSIFQHAPIAIVALDLLGNVTTCNPTFERWFGWTARAMRGARAPFVPESGRDLFDSLLAQVLSGATIEDVEVHPVNSDGASLTVSLHAAPLRSADGRLVGCVAIMDDLTAQHAAAEATSASQARFAALVERSSDLNVVLDAAIRFLYVSPAASEFLGRPADELVGEPAPPPHPDDAARVDAVFNDLAGEPGGVRRLEYRQQRADGEWRHISVTMTNLLTTPSVGGMVLNIRDVSDRVEGEAALRSSEERLRALVASASDIISIVEPDGLIRYSGPVSERMLGYVEGAAPGLSIFDIIHPDEEDAVRRLWRERSDTAGFVSPIEVRLLKADGTWLQAEVIANNMIDDLSVRGVVITTRDITERKVAEQALRRSDERFRALVQNLAEAIVVIGHDGEILYASPSASAMVGDPSPMNGEHEPWPELERIHPDDRERVEAALGSVLTDAATIGPLDLRVRHSDGHWVQVEASAQNMLDDQAVGGVVVTLRDITKRRHAEDLNAHEAEILRLVATGTPLEETLDQVARLGELNDPSLHCTICTVAEGGSTLRPAAAPSFPDSIMSRMACSRDRAGGCPTDAASHELGTITVSDIEAEDYWHMSRQVLLEHGLRCCWSTPLVSVGSGEVLGMLSVFSEQPGGPSPQQEQRIVTAAHLAAIAIERKRFEARLLHQSLHDPLTALPNRSLFHDRLSHALDRGRRARSGVAVLFIDLDRFKLVNDSLGHDAGDELLVSMATRLAGALRPGDTVGRFGGDEFTVLCEDLPTATAAERAAEIAQRLQGEISKPTELRDTEIFLTASIGIAIALDEGALPDDLLRDADAAMYHAKNRGTGRWEVFDQALRERALRRNETETALHRAIERGELRLFYQPMISIAEQRCVGAEALVRWQHPERGLVPPGDFIDLAEESGLIHDLGRWVLHEAATQTARWQANAPDDFTVSVNISGRQLAQGDLHEIVAETLRATGARPERLCLEITESILMEDTEQTVELIKRVRDLGVRFSIDDFGTGYSSLGYLKSFPVDAVKVDRTFVSTMTSDRGDAAIVAAVVGLAHALNLRVVAEGVETAEQLAALAALGCELAQGFYFSPPQPVADLHRIFGRWRVPDTANGGRRSSHLPDASE